MSYVRIVPVAADPGSPTLTQFTRVFTAAGEEIDGVDRIELIAEPNGYWRARIDVLAHVDGSIVAQVLGAEYGPPTPPADE